MSSPAPASRPVYSVYGEEEFLAAEPETLPYAEAATGAGGGPFGRRLLSVALLLVAVAVVAGVTHAVLAAAGGSAVSAGAPPRGRVGGETPSPAGRADPAPVRRRADAAPPSTVRASRARRNTAPSAHRHAKLRIRAASGGASAAAQRTVPVPSTDAAASDAGEFGFER